MPTEVSAVRKNKTEVVDIPKPSIHSMTSELNTPLTYIADLIH
jgi:hypothetical protein